MTFPRDMSGRKYQKYKSSTFLAMILIFGVLGLFYMIYTSPNDALETHSNVSLVKYFEEL